MWWTGWGWGGWYGYLQPHKYGLHIIYILQPSFMLLYCQLLDLLPILPSRWPDSSALQELNPAFYGLQTQQTVRTAGLLSAPPTQAENVAQLEQLLRDIYCGNEVSAEFAYVEVSSGHIIFCIPSIYIKDTF